MADDAKVLMRLKKAQLVDACAAVGLDTEGKKAELVERLVAHGRSKSVSSSSRGPAAPATAPSDDDDDDEAVPSGISFAAARQAAIAAEAAEAEAAARLAQKRRKRPRKAAVAEEAPASEGSDDELDDAVFEEAAAAEAADARGSDAEPGTDATAGSGAHHVTLKPKGRRRRRKGPVRDEEGRHVVFGDEDPVVAADARRKAAEAAAFLQGHFYGDRLQRDSVRRAAGRRLGPARGFGAGREPARRPSKRGRGRK